MIVNRKIPLKLPVLLVLLVLAGCQSPAEEKQESWVNPYQHLIDKDPDKLSYTELYNRALNLWTVPFEEMDCKTSFGTAHVIVSGPKDAPPMVLLHGMNASSTMWYPNIGELSKKHRVYAIDCVVEVNKSEMKGEVNSTDEIVEWYGEVFTCLGLQQFDLVGASRGGWLAVKIALKNPARIKNLVLLSPAQTFVWISPSLNLLTNVLYTVNPKKEDLGDALQTLSYDVKNIEQLYVDQYFKATTESERFSLMDMTPFEDGELATLKMPVLLLIGDNDFINDEESIERAETLLAEVKAGIIRHSGHFLSIDQAREVNSRTLKFLEGK